MILLWVVIVWFLLTLFAWGMASSRNEYDDLFYSLCLFPANLIYILKVWWKSIIKVIKY